jgi:CBS domain-containing protein
MQVDSILRTKGTLVHTVTADARLGEAVHVLNSHNIGAVVVVDTVGQVVGILSERDVVRKLDNDPGKALDRLVRDCMTTLVVTCTRQTTVAELMELMTQRRIRHIPIVEESKLLGIVSIGDVVKRKIAETEQEAQALKEYISA